MKDKTLAKKVMIVTINNMYLPEKFLEKYYEILTGEKYEVKN